MALGHKPCEQFVGSIQIFTACNPVYISCRLLVIILTVFKQTSLILNDPAYMRIDIIIILDIILMIGRRDEQRIKYR